MHILWPQTWWLILVPTATHMPSFITVAHTKVWIFTFLVISQREQICKWGIPYARWWHTTWVVLVHITTHMYQVSSMYPRQNSGYLTFLLLANQNRYANEVLNMCLWWRQTTRVVLVSITTHIPSFINVAHTEIWIFDFFVISQSEQICKWGIKYAHSLTTDHVGGICDPLLPTYQIWWKSVIAFSLESEGLPFDVHEKPTSVHTYVHTSRQCDKWKLSGPSSQGSRYVVSMRQWRTKVDSGAQERKTSKLCASKLPHNFFKWVRSSVTNFILQQQSPGKQKK